MISRRAPGVRILPPTLALSALLAAGACATAKPIGPPPGGGIHSDPSPAPPEFRFPVFRFSRMRGIYRVTVFHEDRKRSFRQILALAPPDRVRLEMLGPMGPPRLILAFDGRGAVGLYPKEKIYFWEELQETAFAALLGVPLTARELVPLLTGEVFSREPDTRVQVPVPFEEGWKMAVEQPGSGLHYVLFWSATGRRIRRVDLHRGDKETPAFLSVDYPGGSARPKDPVPSRWEFWIPGVGLRLAGVLKKIEFDGVVFTEELFRPSIPPGFRRVAARDLAPDRPLLAIP